MRSIYWDGKCCRTCMCAKRLHRACLCTKSKLAHLSFNKCKISKKWVWYVIVFIFYKSNIDVVKFRGFFCFLFFFFQKIYLDHTFHFWCESVPCFWETAWLNFKKNHCVFFVLKMVQNKCSLWFYTNSMIGKNTSVLA